MCWVTELYVVKLKIPKDKKYSKSLSFEDIKEFLEVRSCDKNYENYIKPGLFYFTEDLNVLAKELGVDRIVPMGLFIRGIYGGERKKGEEEYAGLIVLEHSVEGIMFKLRLYNTKDTLIIPVDYLKKYGVKIYKMIYGGEINPFKINKHLDIVLSERGENALKKFLEEALKLNERNISMETNSRVKKLIDEVRQPTIIKPLDIGRYYVVYRCDRAFTGSIYKPSADSIVHSNAAYLECRDENIAYYYVAVLNYLAYAVVATKRTFIRHQWARPLLAIYIAGLSWNSMNEGTRNRIVELSKTLHEKAPSKKYVNQRIALKDIAQLSEFRELVKTIDSKISKESLEEALNMVSGKGVEE
jgi:hypothetical protein